MSQKQNVDKYPADEPELPNSAVRLSRQEGSAWLTQVVYLCVEKEDEAEHERK